MSKPCTKHRIRSIVIILEPNHEQKLRCICVTLQCHECGQPFEFSGIFEGPGVKLSADRRELRVDITEAQKWMVQ
jgi:hypothetical protein